MPYDQSQSQAVGAGLTALVLIYAIIGIAITVFSVIIAWRIFAKAGYSGAMGLLMFIPVANLIAVCILAFGNWPIYQELNQLRQRAGGTQYPQNPQYVQGQAYPQNPQYPQGPQQPQNPRNPQYP